MLKLRLQRVGRIHEPSFRLVLTESKNSTKSGRFKEILGSYDPRKSTDSFDAERIKHWLSQGVGITGTVHNLLVKHRIINAKKINVSAKSKKATVTSEPVAETPEAKEATSAESSGEPKEVKEEATKTEEVPQEEAPAESAITPTLSEGEVGAPTENVGVEGEKS